MTLLVDQFPTASLSRDGVSSAALNRHLGFPAGVELDERMQQLAEQAQSWYQEHGEPWHTATRIRIDGIEGDTVCLDRDYKLKSSLLAAGLGYAEAEAIIVVAATAGAAVDRRIDELWKAECPDEALFLNAYAIAVVEQLRARAAGYLRGALAPQRLSVLPHYSPGYDGWHIVEHRPLLAALASVNGGGRIPVEVLESGGLQPAKSIVAVYGITPRVDLAEARRDFWSQHARPTNRPSKPVCEYAFAEKTLKLWRDRRLHLSASNPQEITARFRFDGSTCNSMGVPIAMDYEVRLVRTANGDYTIAASSCQTAQGDVGFQSTCAFLEDPDSHMAQVANYRPLVGRSLSEALSWNPPTSPAGCLCSQASQDHKWRIVLQTIHFALKRHEQSPIG